MTRQEYEDRVLNLVKDSLPFNEYLQVLAWLDSHRKVEDLYSKIDRLYKFGVSEIRTSMNFDTRCEITAQVANVLIDEIKKPLLEEIAKQKEILNVLKKHIFHQRNIIIQLGIINRECEREDFKKIQEWLEND